MNEQTVSTRHLVRSVLVAAFIVMLALTTPQRAGANQSGDPVSDAANFQARLCELAGGKATIEVSRTPGSGRYQVVVKCEGGYLDDMFCRNFSDLSFCTFEAIRQPETGHVDPAAGVENPVAPIDTPATTDEAVEPGPAEEPGTDQSATVDESVDQDQAAEPAVDEGDGSVIDQPASVDESIDPVGTEDSATEEPVIEVPPTVEDAVDPGTADQESNESGIVIGADIPVLVGQ